MQVFRIATVIYLGALCAVMIIWARFVLAKPREILLKTIFERLIMSDQFHAVLAVILGAIALILANYL